MRWLSDLYAGMYIWLRKARRAEVTDSAFDSVTNGSTELVPDAYRGAAELLRGIGTTEDVVADTELVKAMAQAVRSTKFPTRRQRMIGKFLTMKAISGAAGLVFATGGAAAAATGSLPAPAQNFVSNEAGQVGINVTAAAPQTTVTTTTPTTVAPGPTSTTSTTLVVSTPTTAAPVGEDKSTDGTSGETEKNSGDKSEKSGSTETTEAKETENESGTSSDSGSSEDKSTTSTTTSGQSSGGDGSSGNSGSGDGGDS